MSHHLVTVCMFCLLCASHTSCNTHNERDSDDVLKYEPKFITAPEYHHKIEDLRERREKEKSPRYYQKLHKIRGHKTDVDRRKRDAKHEKTEDYVEQIFRQFGDPESMTMNLTGFNSMLASLNLEKLTVGGVQKKKDDVEVTCMNSKQIVESVNTRLKDHEGHSHEELETHGHTDHEQSISKETLQDICPILLYQMVKDRDACVVETSLPRAGHLEISNQTVALSDYDIKENRFYVWLYSSLSITAISLCGLLGVAVIPIMQKSYYNHMLQFFVALAVGTLCGDALLHLMPHAMGPPEHSHGHEGAVSVASHDDSMWKGLAAMMGVVFFYFTEKGLNVVVEWRKRRQRLEENKLPSRVRVLKDDDHAGSTKPHNSNSKTFMKIFKKDEKSDPTTKTCKHKYSEYPYCYDEIETDTHDDHHHRDGQAPPSPKPNHNSVSVVSSNALGADGKEEPTAKDWLLKAEANSVVEMNNIKKKEDGAKDLKDGDSYTVILREHSRAHHGHSHAHGHVHAPPSSMSSVAWMVIMGDGLHNFTDGMAIGAAFASNIAGGFSTAIAVLCHELPHEIGDFAVLLKAGMSVRRAVYYNALSSALCLCGMVCGVAAGGAAPDATRWLFAGAAGMFLYIALVDMMPELASSHSNEGTLLQCALQLAGLASGIGIMLLIAIYEHDLKTLFS